MQSIVMSGTALIAATYGLARFGYGLFLPQFTVAFGVSPTAAGVISAASFVSYCVASALAFELSAHPRRLVTCAGGSAALGSLGVAVSSNVVLLALSVVVAGAGAGFASPGLVSLIERNVARSRQEIAQTIVNSGTGSGIAVAGMLMVLTLGHWRTAWLIIAFVVLVATIAVLSADTEARKGRAHPPSPRRPARPGGLALLSRPIVAAGLAGMSSSAIWTFGPSIMTSARVGEDAYTTTAWMVLGTFGALGATAGRLVQAWDPLAAWTMTCVVMATATILLGLAPASLFFAYAAVAAFGAGYTALSGVLIVWAVRVTPERQAEGTIVLFIALAVGQAIGSAGLGLVQNFATTAVTFSLAGLVGVLALVPVMRDTTRPV